MTTSRLRVPERVRRNAAGSSWSTTASMAWAVLDTDIGLDRAESAATVASFLLFASHYSKARTTGSSLVTSRESIPWLKRCLSDQ